jgi:hypothetical protein
MAVDRETRQTGRMGMGGVGRKERERRKKRNERENHIMQMCSGGGGKERKFISFT